MSFAVFLLVLGAAALHAGWNLVVKRAEDKSHVSVMVAAIAGLLAGAALPFLPAPAPAAWPWIAASVALQVVYWIGLANAYRIADMSRVYPLMRGAAPLIVAMVSITAFGDHLGPVAWAGVSAISLGIAALAVSAGVGARRGMGVALATAAVIAAYTIVDGIGVRRSGSPIAYTAWIFLATAVPLVLWALLRDPVGLARHARRHWPLGLFGGVATLASYGIALWAMTRAPVAVVAALRETSILFGIAFAAVLLKEPVDRRRLVAVTVVVIGAAALRLA